MTACETCKSDYSCGRLAAAMKVVEALPDLDAQTHLKASYERLKKILDEAGWRYPDAKSACQFADKEVEIRSLTNVLILELDRVRAGTPYHRPSLLSEELAND